MRAWLWVTIFIIGAASSAAGQSAPDDVEIQRWFLGVQAVNSHRENFDVFDRDDLWSGSVAKKGEGIGFVFGRRFGDRFLLGVQLVGAGHDIDRDSNMIIDLEGLITGTVLFPETSFFQTFLRGGFGLGAQALTLKSDNSYIISYGPSAIAGLGIQMPLTKRLSLELEGVSTFTNYIAAINGSESESQPLDSWKVRESNWGWRFGAGLLFWF